MLVSKHQSKPLDSVARLPLKHHIVLCLQSVVVVGSEADPRPGGGYLRAPQQTSGSRPWLGQNVACLLMRMVLFYVLLLADFWISLFFRKISAQFWRSRLAVTDWLCFGRDDRTTVGHPPKHSELVPRGPQHDNCVIYTSCAHSLLHAVVVDVVERVFVLFL